MISNDVSSDELDMLCQIDDRYRAALHILCCPPFDDDVRVWRFVKATPAPGIDFATMLRRGRFVHHERILLRCAWSLFDGEQKLALDDVASYLNPDDIGTVIEAIRIRGGYR